MLRLAETPKRMISFGKRWNPKGGAATGLGDNPGGAAEVCRKYYAGQ